VIEGINDLLIEAGLPDFLIDPRRHPLDPHEHAILALPAATRADGTLDGGRLRRLLLEARGNGGDMDSAHAHVIITALPLASGVENWGQAEFDGGYAIISLPGLRQRALGLVRNIAKHEAGHLLGFQEHHDTTPDIGGYAREQDCNMLFEAPSTTTCGKCLDALIHFWQGLEGSLGQRFRR
jgi:hypothetical protein